MKRVNTGVLDRQASCSRILMLSAEGTRGHTCKSGHSPQVPLREAPRAPGVLGRCSDNLTALTALSKVPASTRTSTYMSTFCRGRPGEAKTASHLPD